MDKNQIIQEINTFKNTQIAEGKKQLTANSDPDKFDGLMTYNAMLDNITIGAHTKVKITYAGYDWNLRLLTAEEFVNINLEINKECKDKECWDDWFTNYHKFIKILHIANTDSPFKLEGNLSEKDLKLINYDVLEQVYYQYIDFVNKATKKPMEFTDEEVEVFINIARKKPELLREYERQKLLVTTHWFLNYSQHLEKMLKSDTTS